MDVILKVDEIPKVGETKIAEEMKIAGGGKGVNQAAVISRFGRNVCIVEKAENDKFRGNLIDSLKDSGVDIKGIVVDEFNSTGKVYITASLCTYVILIAYTM